MRVRFILTLTAAIFLGCGSESPTDPLGESFTVEVAGERFRMFVTDAEAIGLARQNFEGGNGKFPLGQIRRGHSGLDQPYEWSYVPGSVRMVDTSMELCDGRPSYVNAHIEDYLNSGYCPWGARVVALKR